MHQDGSNGKDRFGEIMVVVGIVVYLIAVVFYVFPLPRRLDTFLSLSLLFTPVIVGGLIYARIARSGGWSRSRTLR